MRYVSRWLAFLTHPATFVAYFIMVAWSYFYIDQPLALKMHDLALQNAYPVLVWTTQLGRSLPYLILLPLLALFFRYVKRSKQSELRVWFFWSTLMVTNAVCFVLKNLLGRARPTLLFDQHLFGFYGVHTDSLYHSFPSGHATLVTAAVLGLTLLFPTRRFLVLALGVAIMATRVLLSFHYLSDILATLYLVVLEYRLMMYVVARECPLYWVRLGVE